MSAEYDVIVVGAGPGGATAAYFLAEAGQKVLVLEKGRPPRYKACGGGLSAQMLADVFPFSFDQVIETRLAAVTFTMGAASVTVPVPRQEVRTVMRDRFDAHLLAKVRAEIRPNVAVRQVREQADVVVVETADGQWETARYVIGADGANSVVAREAGLRRGKAMAAALEAEVPADEATLDRLGGTLTFIFGDVRAGYAWIFPKARHLSVGIMGLRPGPGALQAGLRQMAARYGLRLDGVAIHGHPIPLYLWPERLMTRRVLLVGDAAGLADPLSGEGIRLAIKSGQLAAQALLSGKPTRYPAQVWRSLGWSQMIAAGFAGLYARFPQLMFALGASNPWVAPALMDVLTGRGTYAGVAWRAVATLPLHAVRALWKAAAGQRP